MSCPWSASEIIHSKFVQTISIPFPSGYSHWSKHERYEKGSSLGLDDIFLVELDRHRVNTRPLVGRVVKSLVLLYSPALSVR